MKMTQEKEAAIKLSEAILIGAARRSKCERFLFQKGSSCALGAAYEGLTLAPSEELDAKVNSSAVYEFLRQKYPFLSKSVTQMGMTEFVKKYDFGVSLESAIINMNDVDHCTREEIAKRLAAKGL